MRLFPLADPRVPGGWPGEDGVATGMTPFAKPLLTRLAVDARVLSVEHAGYKAARLAAAQRAGLPVLPGWVVPVAEGSRAISAGADAVRANGLAAGRMTVLGRSIDSALSEELRCAVDRLEGKVIVRSSSPLEGDGRWAGAFSSVTGVGRDDVVTAVRSCWASAFAVDPLERLEECGLVPGDLELGVLIQPEISPAAGGVARVTGEGAQVAVEGVRGHPAALLSGWAEGASAEVALSPGSGRPTAARAVPARHGQARLTQLLGDELVEAVACLAGWVWLVLGDDVIEWAADGAGVWLFQSLRSASLSGEPLALEGMPPLAEDHGLAPVAVRQGLPGLAADIMRRGAHVPGRPGAPGMAVGRLMACGPHERPPGGCEDAILLVGRPVPALAPLLFGARGVIARSGAAGAHLAGVARSLGVPMVIGCDLEPVTGPPPVPGDRWLTAINGSTGDVALLPAGQGG